MNVRTLGRITMIASALFASGCHPTPTVTDECMAWTPDKVREQVHYHLQRNDALGTKDPHSLTTEDIFVGGNVSFDKASGLWVFPFWVDGSTGYYALVDCEGYTELSSFAR